MILLTEDQLNGLFNQLRGSCLKAYEQENEHSSSDFVIAAILDTPNPPLPVSEDREVWVEVSVDDELPEAGEPVFALHKIDEWESQCVIREDGRWYNWWDDFDEDTLECYPSHWLKKVKLSSLVLNSSDNISVHDAMNHKADKNQSNQINSVI